MWENIPQELKYNALWCCWKKDPKGKIPFNVKTGGMAQSNNKNTFYPFLTILKYVDKYDGLGLGIFNGYSAIDIDKCIDENGNLSDMASDIIQFIGSYTEYSPSGKGIRIIFKTKVMIDKATHYVQNHKRGLEIYISDNTNKFVTITGNVLYASEIKEVDITYILDTYMKKDTEPKRGSEVAVNQEGVVDLSVLRRALNRDEKLAYLWNKTASGSGGDESETDLALINKLSFYLQKNRAAVEQAFIDSPYFQSKDDLHKRKWLDRTDYRETTIQTAFESVVTVYNPNFNKMYPLNDTGNAHRFVDKFGENIRYNVDNAMWMIWNGQYWQFDQYKKIKQYAEILVEEMKQQALLCDDPDLQKDILKNVNRTSQSSGKENMLKESQHLFNIPVTNLSFDYNPLLFNCKSGVIDLTTGKLLKHDRTLMLSKYSGVDLSYDEPKRWLKFLDEVFQGDKELIHYMQKVLGYSITGETKEQSMFVFEGDGSNGKSVLLDIMSEVTGSYGATSNSKILLDEKNGNSNLSEIARLNGIRNVVVTETKIGDRLNESAIKDLTSGIGKIVARFLYGNEFEFDFIGKIFMATNHRPVIRGTDHGIWRRIRTIKFKRVFTHAEQDRELIYKLRGELPQILGWVVKGCVMWQKEGLYPIPKSVEDANREYRSEMDIVEKWLNECCETGDTYKEKSSDLFSNLCSYIAVNKEYQITNTMFGRNMGKKFEKKRIGAATYYIGIKLSEDNEYKMNRGKYENV